MSTVSLAKHGGFFPALYGIYDTDVYSAIAKWKYYEKS